MKERFNSFIKIIAYTLTALILIFAVLMTSVRSITPMLDAHREDIEKWATLVLDMPVKIEKARITWYQYQPEVTLDQVTFLNRETRQPSLKINRISISFSLPKSIWHWQPVPSGIMIDGTALDITQDKKNEISIQGFPMGFVGAPYQSETKFKDMLAMLYVQPRIILHDIDVRYTNYSGQKRYVTLYDLRLDNQIDHQHRLQGKAVLHQQIPTEATLVAKWIGNDVDINKIRAKVYVYVSGLSLAQWFKNYHWQNWEVVDGILSTKIWAKWEKGQFQKLQSTIQAYDITIHSFNNNTVHKITRFSGNLGWKREGKKQIFAGNDILIDFPNHLWPMTSFYAALIPDEKNNLYPTTLQASYLNLSDVQPILLASNVISDDNKKLLSELNINGSLLNSEINFPLTKKDISYSSLKGNINQLSFSERKNMPGISNLSGDVEWNGQSGSILLHSTRVLLRHSSIFLEPIPIDQLTSEVAISRDEKNRWNFQIRSLQILNKDTAANMHGNVMISNTSSPIVNLETNFTMQQMKEISHYLPLRLYDPDLVEWLQSAFLSGEIQSASAILKGKLSDFPFDNNNGTFLIAIKIKSLDLRYASRWPVLKQVNGTVTFRGRQLKIFSDHASILNIPLKQIEAEIPYLGDKQPQILTVKSPIIQTDFADGLALIKSSPLHETIGKLSESMAAKGPITLNLGLTVPLKKPENTQVIGRIGFNNNEINLLPWNLRITQINGGLLFTDKTIDAKNISGLLFNKPLQLNLSTLAKNKKENIIRASLKTNLAVTDLQDWLKISLSDLVKGDANATSDIDFALNDPTVIRLRSDLVGMTVMLPDEYGKSANEHRQFYSEIYLAENAPLRLKAMYNKMLGIAAILQRKNDTFELSGAKLQLGNDKVDWPKGDGIYISGNFNELNWDKIKNYLNQSSNSKFNFSRLKNIDINAKALMIFGQRIEQIHLLAVPKQNDWHIAVKSPDIVGLIETPGTMTNQGNINAKFEKFNLSTPISKKSSSDHIDLKSLPHISFVGDDVSYNHTSLGLVSFKTIPTKNGFSIPSFTISSPNIELQANGDWKDNNTTHLKGVATSKNVSELMANVGVNATNFIVKDGKLNFDLNWPGEPYAPSLAAVNGNASIDLGKGRIIDVGQTGDATMGIGRMLSIFSLQSIPRRLTFDFTDIFQKGYSFDFVRGDFTFKNGDAYTQNLKFNGPVARVDMNGRIGFGDKDYDLTLAVTPYVTSTLPVAAAIITGPIGGVAALAVNQILSSTVATYHYSVKGSWDNPSFETASNKSQ